MVIADIVMVIADIVMVDIVMVDIVMVDIIMAIIIVIELVIVVIMALAIFLVVVGHPKLRRVSFSRLVVNVPYFFLKCNGKVTLMLVTFSLEKFICLFLLKIFFKKAIKTKFKFQAF